MSTAQSSSLPSSPNIIIFGAGAVGTTIGAWLSPHHENLWMVDLPANVNALNDKGITHYCADDPGKRETVKVKAVAHISEAPRPDVIFLCVKNYSLATVSRMIKDAAGNHPLVIGFQNGVENQEVLPQYFSKVGYGIVAYNAWLDGAGVVGYQKRGPLVIGTKNNELPQEMEQIAALLSLGVETLVTPHLDDAAHSKMVVNLTNSLTTLIGHKFQPISDDAIFQKLLTNLTYEGVKIMKAAGYHECRLGGMPSWMLMRAAATLPRCLTKRTFEKNVKKMVMSSMAQDIIQRGGTDSELETINGYFLKLAEKHGVAVPYNRAVYGLCKDRFKPGFKPLDVKEVFARVQQ